MTKTPLLEKDLLRSLGALLDTLGHGLAIFDTADRLHACNTQFLKLHRTEGLHLGEGTDYKAFLEQCATGGVFAEPELARGMLTIVADKGDGFPLDLLLKDGNWLRIEDRCHAWGRIALRYDITESKQTELRLRDSEARFRVLSDATLEGLLLHADGTINDCNAAACQLFGLPVERLLGREPEELVATIDRPRLSDAMRHDTGNVIEITCLRADGSPFLAEARTRRIPSREGNYGVISVRDVTERLRVQETLRRREAILSAVGVAAEKFLSDENWYDSLPPVLEQLGHAAGVSHVFLHQLQQGMDDNLLPRNYQTSRQWAWTAQGYGDPMFREKLESFDPVSAGLAELGDLRRGRPALENLLTTDEERRELMEYAGIQSYCLFPIRPFEEAGDPLWGVVGFLQLDQPRRWNDIEVETLATAVDLISAALRRDQAANQLVEAKDAAERASRAKSEFLAVMSHEIRTPMNAVLGMLGLLAGTELTEEQQDFVDTAKEGADGLMTIIEDILDISKMESGRLALEERDFDLIDQVESVIDLFTPRAIEQGLRLSIDMPFDLPRMVRGDAGRLRQILLNLLGNAVKFTAEGGIRVSVSHEGPETGGGEHHLLRFEVTDTGIGIDAEAMEGLFSEFQQGKSGLDRKHGGTGLGLAICKRLTELLNGRIGVISQPGHGSTFWFTVRLARARTRQAAGATTLPNFPLRRYLMVAAASPVRDSLISQLTSANCEITLCGRFEKVPAKGHYDGILIDAGLFPASERPVVPDAILVQSEQAPVLFGAANTKLSLETVQAGHFGDILPTPFHQSDIVALLGGQPLYRGNRRNRRARAGNPAQAIPQRPVMLLVADSQSAQRQMARTLEKQGIVIELAADCQSALKVLGERRCDLVVVDLVNPAVDGMALAERLQRDGAHEETPLLGLVEKDQEPDAALAALLKGQLAYPPQDEALLQAVTAILSEKLQRNGPVTDQQKKPGKQPDTSAIDRKTVGELRESVGNDVFNDLIDSFETEARQRAENIAEAFATNTCTRMGEEAHALKSLAGSFGAPRLMALAAGLEKQARSCPDSEKGCKGDGPEADIGEQIRHEVDQAILGLRAMPILDRLAD